jgi:hypothetical protein
VIKDMFSVSGGRAGASPTTLYAALVGIAGEVNHFEGADSGSPKYPNMILKVDPLAGPNSGLIFGEVRTHNGGGIARGSELVSDYGNFDLSLSLPGNGLLAAMPGMQRSMNQFVQAPLSDMCSVM